METVKKILIICPFARPNLGGVETHIDKLINFSVTKGYYPVLLTYQPLTYPARGEKHEMGQGFEIYRVSWFGMGLFNKLENYFPLQFLYLFPGLFIKAFFYYVKKHREIYAIHAHGFIGAAITRCLCAVYPKRSIVSTHAIYALETKPILKTLIVALLKPFDQILAVSETSKQELRKIGLAASKIEVHKNWIDTDVLSPLNKLEAKNKLGITEPHNFLFIGRLIEKKGVQLFLESAKHLSKFGFHIVGSGELEEQVKMAAKENPNVHYYGVLQQYNKEEQQKLVSLYNVCDFTVSPYLYDEGFSAILLESLACGTPLIVTKRGSPPTFLSEEVCYFLSPAPTAAELTQALVVLTKGDSGTPENGIPEKPKYTQTVCRNFAVANFGFKNAETITNSYEPNS